jgi:hypothetical protein
MCHVCGVESKHSKCSECARIYRQSNPFKRMVYGARSADKTHGRMYDVDEYITEAESVKLLGTQNGSCCYCKCKLKHGIGINRTNDPDSMTLERVDNDIAHIVDNCVIACRFCNYTRNNTKSFDFMVEHGARLKSGVEKYCSHCVSFYPNSDVRTGWCRGCVSTYKKVHYAGNRVRNKKKYYYTLTRDQKDAKNRKQRERYHAKKKKKLFN